jgi:hypothetical protein
VVPLQLMPSMSRKRSVANDLQQLMVPASLVEPPSCASEHPTAGVGKPAEQTTTPSPGVGGMLMAPIPRIDPSDDTREWPGGSTSESMVIEIARLVAAAVHDDQDLCELQVRFEGQIQEGR